MIFLAPIETVTPQPDLDCLAWARGVKVDSGNQLLKTYGKTNILSE